MFIHGARAVQFRVKYDSGMLGRWAKQLPFLAAKNVAEDARRAVDEGAEVIAVSNHGGRQLDGVSATLSALPEIVSAVGNHQKQILMDGGIRPEILMDGGIRRGGEIVKALCLGARTVLIGRAYAYGLAAAVEPGVADLIEIVLHDDVERTHKLLGCAAVAQLSASFVAAPTDDSARIVDAMATAKKREPLIGPANASSPSPPYVFLRDYLELLCCAPTWAANLGQIGHAFYCVHPGAT